MKSTVLKVLVYPTILAAGAFGFAWWVSTLPAISPVSLSLVFRSWSAIFVCAFGVWAASFCLFALFSLPIFLRPRR